MKGLSKQTNEQKKKHNTNELEHLFILRCITAQLRLEGASGVTVSNNPAYFCIYLLPGFSFHFLVFMIFISKSRTYFVNNSKSTLIIYMYT